MSYVDLKFDHTEFPNLYGKEKSSIVTQYVIPGKTDGDVTKGIIQKTKELVEQHSSVRPIIFID